jgi:hypothetical protein
MELQEKMIFWNVIIIKIVILEAMVLIAVIPIKV